MATPVPALRDKPQAAPRAGGVEDRYRSLFVIGRGGMGSVEVALECKGKGFDRVVALKTLLPEGARDPRHKEMFLREARLAALLQHANVVHAFAFGELFGELFLAMEYVEGEPLSRVLATRMSSDSSVGLDPAIVAFVLAEACDGLHAAHELRDVGGHPLHVVHRDVSPQNIMVAYAGHVKILDFGVAKFETGGHETRTGEVKGKMAYMSPEQALGEKLDRRSDLFSVGAVLFECVTGQRMWGSGTDLEVMRKLALEHPPRLNAVLPSAPGPLVDLHARLVARDPQARPPTARDVAAELRAFARARGAPDRASVRTLMRRLFAAEEAKRRAQLTQALERVAPNSAQRLSQRLDSRPSADRTTSTEPVVMGATPSGMLPRLDDGRDDPRRSRLGLAIALAAAVVVGAGVTAGAMRGSTRPAQPAQEGATPSSAAPAAQALTGPAPAPSPSTSTTPPATPATTSRLGGAAQKPNASGAAGAPARQAPAQRTRARGESKPSGAKLPDVDPTPF
jgi:serine/threonine-protein kinase